MKRIVLAVMAALVVCACPSYAKKAKKTAEVTFEVSMHCKKCVDKITDNVGFEKGVQDLKVDWADKTVYVKYDPSKTNPNVLKKSIEKLGYSAEVKSASDASSDKQCCKNSESTCKDKCCKKDGDSCKKDCVKEGECCKKDGCDGKVKECCKDKCQKKAESKEDCPK